MVEVRRDAIHSDDPAAAAGNSVGILEPGGTTSVNTTRIASAVRLRTTPWRHQREAVAFVQQLYRRGRRGAMIAAAMGTGKSAMTVYLCAEEGFQLTLVLCPLRVVQVWRPQFEMHSTLPFLVVALDDSFSNVRAKRAEAERKLRLAKARGVPVVVVINYDSAWRTPFAEWALKQKWDLVVADEVHRCKAPGGKASRYLARLGKAARFRLGLSGTPMPHSPLDVYGYFRFIDATIFGWSYNRFRQHFAVMGGYQNHQVIAYNNLDELNRRFYSVTFACGKDVLDLPPEVHITYTCHLGSEARTIYHSLERDLIAEVRSGEVTAANALVKLLRLQQITGGHIRTDDGHDVQIDSAKPNLLRDVLEDIDPQEPVVVFCRFHNDLDAVNRVADETGRRSLELSGRVDELKQWQAGAAPVLAVQIDSGGVGVDLTRARYSIYYSLGFSLGAYEQSLARIHRPGQTRPVEYIHLLADGTVDEKVMDALARRADVVNSVLRQMKGGQ
jgi:SNF2 family DNA or RNA helicase